MKEKRRDEVKAQGGAQRAMSPQAWQRLPLYYTHLRALQAQGVTHISAPAMAREMGLNEVQVRKDLAAASQKPGRPRTGFEVEQLLQSIGHRLGCHTGASAVLVGAGQLGRALLGYTGFEKYGVRIVAAFDAGVHSPGQTAGGKPLYPMGELAARCATYAPRVGIITVPAAAAQTVCDALVEGGVSAIWNFAPVHLRAPQGVLVQNENMAASLALLSRHLAESAAVDDA